MKKTMSPRQWLAWAVLPWAAVAVSVPTPVAGALNPMAINQSFLDDWAGVIYADALQQTRAWTVSSGAAATVNSRGFPTQDAQSVLSGSMPMRAGTYRVYTNGTFNVSFNDGTVSAFSNDAATGLKVATWTLPARRTSAIITVSNLTVAPTIFKLMRPIADGSAQSHAFDDLTDVRLASMLGTTKVLRHMDALATNDNLSTTWATRIKPSDEQVFAKDLGTPWEYIIELSNDTQTSPWINIPHKASDDYILKVAQMFRYGSDGTNPFVSDAARQAAINAGQKVYYPLDSNLQVYIEYSNEVWNSQFGQTADVQALALTEGAVPGTPLRYDGISTTASGYNRAMFNRYLVSRAVKISTTFRSVFGDSEMMTRIRPVLMWQVRNGNSHGSYRMNFLTEYYGKVNTGNPVARPASYYFYAGGTALYYSPADPTTIDDAWTSGDFDTSVWKTRLVTDGALALGAGLRYVSYEGGPGFGDPNGGGGEHPLAAQLSADPRLKNEIYEHHQAFSEAGGEMFCYYQLQGGINAHKWTFVYHLDDPLTQRMTAYNTLATQNRAGETVGTLLPATINGGAFSVGAKADATAPTPAPSGAVALAARQWAVYDVRSTTATNYSVAADYTGGATGAVLEFYAGDVKLGESPATGAGTTAAFTFSIPAAKRTGIRVSARAGAVTVSQLTFAAVANSVPNITTASLPAGTAGTAYPSQTMTATGGDGALVWSVSAGSLPAGLTLSSAGVISGTPTTAGTSNFTVKVADSDGVTGASDEDTMAYSIVIAAANSVPSITTTSLPGGTSGTAYPSQTLAATGGNGALVWSLSAGTLPAGLTLSSGGVISGTPTTAGTSNFTVKVADSDGVTGASDEDTQALSITITAVVPVTTTETFDTANFSATAFTSGSYTGQGSLLWNYVNVRQSSLNGSAARLQKTSSGAGTLTTTLANGLKSISVDVSSAISGSSVQVRLVVNGVTIATSPLVDFSTTHTLSVTGLNYTGSTTVKVENVSDVVARVDDIVLTR